jgi:hypothetical protein
MQFFPLLFNDNPGVTDVWEANVNFAIANYGTDAIFSFNEPDFCIDGSACMSVARALDAYEKFIQPFADCGVKLGSPSVTNAGGGLDWLSQFLGNATQRGLTVDFINIHWYACPYCMSYFQDYMRTAYGIGGNRPIWITEYGMDNNQGRGPYAESAVLQFIRNTTYWVEQQSWIEKLSWFGSYKNNLLNANGTGLTQRGDVWNSYAGTNYVYGFSKKREEQADAAADVVDTPENPQGEYDAEGVLNWKGTDWMQNIPEEALQASGDAAASD